MAEVEKPWDGDGSEDNPYIITCYNQWEMLATQVNAGETFDGYYYQLNTNLTDVTTMVGTSKTNSFQGTFDGNGKTLFLSGGDFGSSENPTSTSVCAPFRYVAGATIKNLKIAGDIYTSSQFAGGLIGTAGHGDNLIQNCISSVKIHASRSNDDGTHGGFLARLQGYNGQYCTTTFEGCAFTGSITSTTGTTNVGGFVGWSEWKNNNDDEKGYCTLVINNCFVKPYEDCISSGSMTFARCRNYEKLTINNGYYTQTIGDAQGQLVANDGTAAVGAATATYNVSGLTFYANGVKDSSTTFFNNANVIAREITGYGDSTDSDHWVFIASPATADTDPDDVVNLVAETADYYDLYKLVNTTWTNYKAHEGNIDPGFNLVNGQGYLYATKETKTLVFTGPFNTGDSKEVNLSEGYNLVGNPFTVAAYVNKPYYTLNTDGSAVLTNLPITGNAILPCYGVIVEGENNNDKVTFSTTQPDESSHPNNGGLNVTLTQANTRGNAMLDNAIVSFNEGSRLGKFYFGNQSANIYIPQGNEDYAIAFSEGQGEMPLNFKANENGTYTLSVNPEGVEMNYLHLIDNLTGADVDLLDVARNVSTAPSYTFNAKTTDYESRFRLVFSTNSNETGSDSFAFFSNGNWIISNDGKAILQVIDVNGRILSSEQINGSVSKAIQSVPGVYVIRLANNENVKTQKMVIQ